MRHPCRLYESPIDLLIAASPRRIGFDTFFSLYRIYKDGYFYSRPDTRFIYIYLYRVVSGRLTDADGNYTMFIELRMREFT